MSVLKIMQTIKRRRMLPDHPLTGLGEDVRRACARLWVWTAEADESVGDKEKMWLNAHASCLEMPPEELQGGAFPGDEPEVVAAMEKLAKLPKCEQRFVVLFQAWLLAACDGAITQEEDEFLGIAGEMLCLSGAEVLWLKELGLTVANGDKPAFRNSLATAIKENQQTDPVFWKLLIAYFEQSQDLLSFAADVYLAKGMEYEHQALFDEASRQYEKALEIDKNCAQAYLLRGNIHSRQGNWQAALCDQEAAVELAPRDARTYYGRGLVYQELAENEKALQDFARSLALNPGHAAAYFQRSRLHSLNGCYDLAAADLEMAVEKEPMNDEYYHALAYAYHHVGRVAEAVLKISRAAEINPLNPNWFDSRAEFQIKLGNSEAALFDCEQILSIDPQIARAYLLKGLAQEKANRKAAAMDSYQRFLEMAAIDDPDAAVAEARLKALATP